MSGYIGPIPVPQGIQNKETFTATAGQTTFNTNGYTDGAFISVYLNGVRLINGTDYTATNGSDFVLTQAASVSDVVDFESFNSFSLVSQTFDNLTTKNPTHEDTDGGRESAVSFQGEQSGGEISTLAAIQASHDGTADDQKGDLIFKTNDGSDNNAPTEAMRIDSSGQVGIGSNDPDVPLVVAKDGASHTASAVTIRSTQVGGYGSILNFQSTQTGGTAVTAASIGTIGAENYSDAANTSSILKFSTVKDGTLAERMRILDGGGIAFNGDTAEANALDDYEEGGWLPSFSFSSGSVGYSYRSGQYTKIGRKVFVTANLILNSASSPSGAVSIVTLPFTTGTDSDTTINEGYVSGGSFSLVRNLTSQSPNIRAYIPANGTSIFLTNNHTGQGHVAFDGSLLGSSTLIYLNATYFAAT